MTTEADQVRKQQAAVRWIAGLSEKLGLSAKPVVKKKGRSTSEKIRPSVSATSLLRHCCLMRSRGVREQI